MNFNSSKYCRLLFLFLAIFLLTGCQDSATTASDAAFQSFTGQCFKEFVSADAVTLHFKLSEPDSYGISEPDSPSYGNLSFEQQRRECERARELLKELQKFDPKELSPENRHTYAIFQNALENTAASEEYLLYPLCFGSSGLQAQIPITLSEYYFNKEKDIKTYLSLVNQIPELFEQLISLETQRREAGFISPDFVISNTLEQIDEFLQGSEKTNLLIESFETKIQQLSFLSSDQKTTYMNNNRALVRQVVLPAFQTLRTALAQWENTGSDKERLCQYENGKKYYEWLLSSRVGTGHTPDECISILENQLQNAVKDISSLTEESSDLYTEYLVSTPLLQDADTILSELESDTFIDFSEIPETSYDLKEVPAALASTSAAAFYFLPPIDTENQNVIYINSSRVDVREQFSTLAHEGYPGHLYQTNYFMNVNTEPLRHLLLCDGWEEGWGTYAQLYSYYYMDFEDADRETTLLLQKIYRDNNLISLALSSLSDLYVNYKNYTLEKLTNYLAPYGVEASAAQNIYEYVIENPTGYLSYSIGCYELEKLKTELTAELGDAFDIQEFHKAVLDAGSCPFTISGDRVRARLSKK